MAETREVVASAARNADGNSGALQLADADAAAIALMVSVTAVAGVTPTFDLSVEWSDDGVNWFAADPPDSFAQISANKKVVERYAVKGPYYRIVWDLAGAGASFTFSIDEFESIE